MNQPDPSTRRLERPSTSGSTFRPPWSREPARWVVAAYDAPQGEEGVRWVQLTYVRETIPEDELFPKSSQSAPR